MRSNALQAIGSCSGQLVLISVLICLPWVAFASQETTTVETTPDTLSKNAAYIELGGNAGFFSVNYERALIPQLWLRIGYGWMTRYLEGPKYENYIEFQHESLLMLYYYVPFFPRSNGGIEAGGGILYELGPEIGDAKAAPSYWFGFDTHAKTTGTAYFGFVLRQRDGGFWLRIGIVAFTNFLDLYGSFGIGLGMSF